MGRAKCSNDFKWYSVDSITAWGYLLTEFQKWVGVSQHFLYTWRQKFSKVSSAGDDDQAAEIRGPNNELAKVAKNQTVMVVCNL